VCTRRVGLLYDGPWLLCLHLRDTGTSDQHVDVAVQRFGDHLPDRPDLRAGHQPDIPGGAGIEPTHGLTHGFGAAIGILAAADSVASAVVDAGAQGFASPPELSGDRPGYRVSGPLA